MTFSVVRICTETTRYDDALFRDHKMGGNATLSNCNITLVLFVLLYHNIHITKLLKLSEFIMSDEIRTIAAPWPAIAAVAVVVASATTLVIAPVAAAAALAPLKTLNCDGS